MPWLLYLLTEYGSQTTLSSTPLPQSPTTILCSLIPHFCPSWVFLVTLLSPSQGSPSLSSHGWTEDSPVTPFTQYSPGDGEAELSGRRMGKCGPHPWTQSINEQTQKDLPYCTG